MPYLAVTSARREAVTYAGKCRTLKFSVFISFQSEPPSEQHQGDCTLCVGNVTVAAEKFSPGEAGGDIYSPNKKNTLAEEPPSCGTVLTAVALKTMATVKWQNADFVVGASDSFARYERDGNSDGNNNKHDESVAVKASKKK